MAQRIGQPGPPTNLATPTALTVPLTRSTVSGTRIETVTLRPGLDFAGPTCRVAHWASMTSITGRNPKILGLLLTLTLVVKRLCS